MANWRAITRSFDAIIIKVIQFFLYGYRLLLSPILGGQCRFYPSCSHYMEEAVKTHGSVRGVGLGVWRILRCAPWQQGGYDPVPSKHQPVAGES